MQGSNQSKYLLFGTYLMSTSKQDLDKVAEAVKLLSSLQSNPSSSSRADFYFKEYCNV